MVLALLVAYQPVGKSRYRGDDCNNQQYRDEFNQGLDPSSIILVAQSGADGLSVASSEAG